MFFFALRLLPFEKDPHSEHNPKLLEDLFYLNMIWIRDNFLKVDIIEGRKIDEYPQSTKVLVDIFRSTSTMPLMIKNGAKYIIPTKTVKEARAIKAENPDYVLAGERLGRRMRGFEYGNSPYEVWEENFRDKIVVFTSTNGTKVLDKIKGTGRILIGSFINLSATINAVTSEPYVSIVVSGRPDGVADEDHFFAEYLKARLTGESADESACITKIKKSKGARRLKMMGAKEDIEYSLKVDAVDFPLVFADGKISRFQ